MATTTNFGWETPDDTDLVKDGAAAIRTALGGVDTSFVDLKGGTTGQLLSKASNTDLDFTWAAAPTSGGMTLIATATPSAASTVSFTSISTDYKMLEVVWDSAQVSNTTDYWSVRLNNDSGSNYSWNSANIKDNVSPSFGTATTTEFGNSNSTAPFGGNATSATETFKNKGFIQIWNANQTSGRKTVFWRNWYRDDSSGWTLRDAGGYYFGTSAVSQIDFVRSGTSTMTGTFRLYGVK
jgi:hypothetical protein